MAVRIITKVDKMDTDNYLSDYEVFTESEIVGISAQGIALKNGGYIDFAVCAEVWAKANSVENTACIGDRDISTLCFTFYTLPKPITIQFVKKGRLAEFFSKNNTYQRFHKLQCRIVELGYTTIDMT